MKLSISNIAWKSNDDKNMLDFLRNKGYDGLEIAPTRIFPVDPYSNDPTDFVKQAAPLVVSSMQSILFGRTENIFRSPTDYATLYQYTKKAIDFAQKLSCGNIVFGCPKNRDGYSPEHHETAVSFFGELGNYAASKGTVLALEPNPPLYGTNFLNTTQETFDFVRKVDVDGLMVNIDLGTIINNNEDIAIIERFSPLVNHIHISEPNLNLIEKRQLHKDLAQLLHRVGYSKYVSIEMKTQENIDDVKDTLSYIYNTFS